MIKKIIIDANNLGYIAYHAIPKTLSDGDIKTGVLFGFLSKVCKIANDYECNDISFCWDSKRSYRKLTHPGYKERENNVDKISLYEQFGILKNDILPSMGFVNIFEQTGIEADDLIARICHDYRSKNKLIVSNDKDLFQCLDYHTWILKNSLQISLKDFYNEFGHLHPSVFYPQIKALAGCPSDKIRGIDGVGEITAARYFTKAAKGISINKIELINQNKDEFFRVNLPLVKLPHEKTKRIRLKPNTFDKKRTVDVFQRYKMNNFLNNFDKWEVFFNGDPV